MNFVLSSLALLACLFACAQSQPIADARSNYYNYFFELLNPSWRQHRARLRPFGNQMGSPIANVRGQRSVDALEQKLPKAECIYSLESLYCIGLNEEEHEMKVECDAREDFSHTKVAKINKYAISDIRILRSGSESNIVKMYLFAQNTTAQRPTWCDARIVEPTNEVNVFSLHTTDNLTDKGLTVLDRKCWEKMVKFFMSLKVVEEIPIEKGLPTPAMVKSIANLNIL